MSSLMRIAIGGWKKRRLMAAFIWILRRDARENKRLSRFRSSMCVPTCVVLYSWLAVGNSGRTGWSTLSLVDRSARQRFSPPTYERRDQVASPSVNLNALLERNTLSPRYDPPSRAGIDPYFFLPPQEERSRLRRYYYLFMAVPSRKRPVYVSRVSLSRTSHRALSFYNLQR